MKEIENALEKLEQAEEELKNIVLLPAEVQIANLRESFNKFERINLIIGIYAALISTAALVFLFIIYNIL